jgi:hypothetical protein
VTIIIQPVFNGQPLMLNEGSYTDEHGDTLNIEVFKFYLTHVALDYPGNRSILIRKAFLFNAEDSDALSFSADNMAEGSISGISFTLGVDSIDNTSGANEDDLDPVKGMYWVWNSGYIMAKLEGRSKVCKTLHHGFEFHIGGYMPPCNAARAVHISLPEHTAINAGENTVITIHADVSVWFKENVDLALLNNIVTPGKEAGLMADRYAKMFSAR